MFSLKLNVNEILNQIYTTTLETSKLNEITNTLTHTNIEMSIDCLQRHRTSNRIQTKRNV